MIKPDLLTSAYSQAITAIYHYWLEQFSSQPQLAKKILRYLDIQPTDFVLDIGGGSGSLANLLRLTTGANLVVADASPDNLEKGRQKYYTLKFVHSRAEYLAFPDAEFDYALMVRMLHFVHTPELAIKEASRVLKPGGKLFIADTDFSTPLNNYFWRPLKTLVISKTDVFTPDQIDEILAKYGFRPQRHTASGLLISALKIG